MGCSGERYARPPGPVPVYEEAPVLAWDAGAVPEAAAAQLLAPERTRWADSDIRPSDIRPSDIRLGELRLPARSVIQRVAERASDERRNSTNVSDD